MLAAIPQSAQTRVLVRGERPWGAHSPPEKRYSTLCPKTPPSASLSSSPLLILILTNRTK